MIIENDLMEGKRGGEARDVRNVGEDAGPRQEEAKKEMRTRERRRATGETCGQGSAKDGKQDRRKEDRQTRTDRKGARARPNQDTTCAMPNREHKTTQPDRATPNREAQGSEGMGTGRKRRGSRGREDGKSDHHTGGEQGSAKGHEAKR